MNCLGRLVGIVGLCAVAFGGACSTQASSGKGSETSWLSSCASDDDCAVGQCVCGVCTTPCSANSDCPGGSDPGTCAVSGSTGFSTLCGVPVATPTGVCVHGCGDGAVCPNGFACTDGACLPETGTATSGVVQNGSQQAGSSTAYFADAYISVKGLGPVMKCVPRSFETSADGEPACVVMKFSFSGTCDCSSAGLMAADPRQVPIGQRILRNLGGCGADPTHACESACVCEVPFFPSGPDRTTCLENSDPNATFTTTGYCYIDPEKGFGSVANVAKCPSNEMHALHVGGLLDGSTIVMACFASGTRAPEGVPGLGRLGAACVQAVEADPSFAGYQPTEVSVETGSANCATGVCLVNHFRGRVTCPYGQPDPAFSSRSTEECYTPEPGHERVTTKVDGWIAPGSVGAPSGRTSNDAAYCSCRCDGPDPSVDYCECPMGFECTPLIDEIGRGRAAIAGSYCLKAGTVVANPRELTNAGECQRPLCGP
jgi:hypothetical protein